MIYDMLKPLLLKVMKAPGEPPDPPAGSKSSIQTFRASPRFLLFKLVTALFAYVVSIVFFTILGISILLAGEEPALGVFLLVVDTIIVASSLLTYCTLRLDYDMRYYIVTDRSLRIREGIWNIRESTYTFANVQNLSVNQGPIERMLGFANLHIHTAGGSGGATEQQMQGRQDHIGILRGISNVQEVRDQIQVLLRKYRDAGLGDHEEQTSATKPVFNQDTTLVLTEILKDLRASADLLHTRNQ